MKVSTTPSPHAWTRSRHGRKRIRGKRIWNLSHPFFSSRNPKKHTFSPPSLPCPSREEVGFTAHYAAVVVALGLNSSFVNRVSCRVVRWQSLARSRLACPWRAIRFKLISPFPTHLHTPHAHHFHPPPPPHRHPPLRRCEPRSRSSATDAGS